jgi:hypothetical protein
MERKITIHQKFLLPALLLGSSIENKKVVSLQIHLDEKPSGKTRLVCLSGSDKLWFSYYPELGYLTYIIETFEGDNFYYTPTFQTLLAVKQAAIKIEKKVKEGYYLNSQCFD